MIGRRALLALPLAGAAAAAEPVGAVLPVAGGRIELLFDDALPAALHAPALAWVGSGAAALTGWLGRFPVSTLDLQLQAAPGRGVKGGSAHAEPLAHVRIRIGRDSRAADFADDWVLVHELLHLAVPRLRRVHNWLHEGIATYAEGAVRVQAGLRDAAAWWGELVRGLPQGQPAAGDGGLDHTPTWGRTYWGGALFCLQADVAMRRHDPARGLRQALQGVLAAGGSYEQAWPLPRLLATADAAVGGKVLATLYAQHRDRALAVDLPALWQALGVDTRAGPLPRLDDDAPLAAVRRAIAA